MRHYLLDENKEPYEVSFEEGLELYRNPQMKIVKQDLFDNSGILISTVFLGFDHAHPSDYLENSNQKPILFETMIFNGPHHGYQERYTSYVDALKGHAEAIKIAISKDE